MTMNHLEPIRTEADHERAMARIDELWGSSKGTPQGDELKALFLLVEAYELECYPMPDVDPLVAIEFAMDQAGLTSKDVESLLAQSGIVDANIDDILSSKQSLRLDVAEALHRHLSIPMEDLIKEEVQKKKKREQHSSKRKIAKSKPQRVQLNVQTSRTSEIAFNVRLLDVLKTKHPHWRDHTGVEQQGVLRETALRPDIVIRPPGGIPVVLETEFMPARSVEADAQARLGQFLQYNGDRIEQTIAVQVPRELSEVPQADLEQHIEAAEFRYCTYSLQEADMGVRWPATGWLVGSVDDLASCIENVSLSERLLAEGTQILEQSIGEAAGKLRETAGTHALENMAQSLHQEDGEQTSRMAMAIVANALVFHTAIVEAHGIATIDELRIPGRNDVSKGRLLECWQHILDNINYYPIFRIASDLLLPIPDGTANAVLNRLAQAASDLAGLGATTLHDLSGRMFQRLIADRKFLATFYTLPTSAALLGELAVARLDAGTDWSDADALTGLQVADLACGTGALISAAYRALAVRYRRTGGDDQALHQQMMERALIASDIMPAATHLTASMLSSAHPGTTFGRTRVHTLPYGQQSQEKRHTMALGALDLIEDDAAPSLFGTGATVAHGTGADVETEGGQDMILPRETADLVIMNPPFTRPTNHEKAEVPVPSFAGLSKTEDEQQAMAKRLAEIRRRLANPVGHGNAGLASNFIDLAHVKTKPGGVLALVLPASCVSGGSWEDVRRLLEREYEDLAVLTVAAYGQTDRAFSADTGMAEALVVATKKRDGREGCRETLFINLRCRPRSLAEAFEIARAVSRISPQTRQGRLCVGDRETIGTYIRAPLGQGGCASLRETTLADAALGLIEKTLRLPQGYSTSFPATRLEAIGKKGLLHRDISGKTSNGAPRGPFEIIPIQGVPQYPVLWGHDAERERSLIVPPDSEGEVRPGCDDRAVSVWKRTASQLHFNLDFQINSQSLTACLTPAKAIGGRAWPNFIPEQDEWTLPLVLWSNTTLGLLAFWWVGTRQQQGRACLTITQLPRLTVLDPRSLSQEQLTQAESIFDQFKEKEFLPANEAYRDDARQALDRAVLVDLLRLPEAALEPLAILRDQWCAEPSVHGGKKTRIDA